MNLQNVPFSLKLYDGTALNLKSLFIPDEGFDIYDLDISNAEMRTLCAYSMDEHLIGAFNEGKDVHSLTGAGISNGKFTYEDLVAKKEDKTSEEYRQRQIAKKVNFGTIYMMGGATLKQRLWADNRVEITEEQAQNYLDQFFTTYPGVAKYIQDTKEMADKLHFVYTYFGRRRRFPYSYYMSSDKERMYRQAVNSRIQGTSSDLVMLCLIRLGQWLRARNDGSRVLLTVHDSILFQMPHGCHDGLKATLDKLIVDDTREQCPWLPVKWAYDCGWGPNYGDTHGAVT